MNKDIIIIIIIIIRHHDKRDQTISRTRIHNKNMKICLLSAIKYKVLQKGCLNIKKMHCHNTTYPSSAMLAHSETVFCVCV